MKVVVQFPTIEEMGIFAKAPPPRAARLIGIDFRSKRRSFSMRLDARMLTSAMFDEPAGDAPNQP